MHLFSLACSQKGAENPNAITIIGYEDACEMARDRIMELVKEAEAQSESDGHAVSVIVKIEPSVHGRIIGAKGKLSSELGVQIKFPRVCLFAVCSCLWLCCCGREGLEDRSSSPGYSLFAVC